MAGLVRVSAQGSELAELVDRARGGPRASRSGSTARRIIGIAGEPGAGKSLLAGTLVRMLEPDAAGVALDGFHLSDAELDRQGTRDRKGAPETFDAWGYAALLARLRGRPPHPVYAPGFERTLEQPVAASVAVAPEVGLVVTEGNYLLLDRPEWRAARAEMDEVWFVRVDPDLRLERLVARHEEFGKSREEARRWVARVDQHNARLVRSTRSRADIVVDVTDWTPLDPQR